MVTRTKRIMKIVFSVISFLCFFMATVIVANAFDLQQVYDRSSENADKKAYYVNKDDSFVEYGTDPLTGQEGLYSELVSRDVLTLRNVIDLNEFYLDNQPFIQFSAVTSQRYKAEYTRITVKIFDVYDPENYLTVQISADPQKEDTTNVSYFLACASNGQKLTGYEKNKNKIHVNNEYGAFSHVTFCNYWGVKDYTSLYYDVVEKSIYAINFNGARAFIIDFDDPIYFGNFVWDGFTSNEVYCTISCDNYKTDRAKVLVRSYGNYDLQDDQISDDVAPVLNIEYGGYTKDNVPNALLNKNYPIFNASAFDAVDGEIDVDVKAYINYYSSQKMEISIKNGGFTPKFTVYYYIVYTAADSHGNTSEEIICINVVPVCEPLNITFENPTTTCINGNVYTLPQYEVSGGLGNKNLTITATLNGQSINIVSNSIRPYNTGELKIKYEMRDYIGQKFETEITVNVLDATSPTFIEEPILPKYMVKGNKYRIPELKAHDYINGNGEAIDTDIFVETNGEKSYVSDGFYIPGNVSTVDIVYVAAIGNAKSEYRRTIPVYVISDENGLDMSKMFLHGNGGATVATTEAVELTANDDDSFEFINYVSALSLRTSFSLGKDIGGLSKFHILITDIKDSTRSLKFTYEFIGSEAYFYVNDIDTNKVLVKGELSAEKRFRLNFNSSEKKVLYDLSNNNVLAVRNFLNGEIYEGFTNNRVYLSFLMEGVSQETTVCINEINNNYFSNEKEDWIKPIMAWAGDIGGQNEINSKLILPELVAIDVISGDADVYITIKTPSGEIVKSTTDEYLNNVSYDGSEIEFILSEYGNYIITVTANDLAGNVSTSNTLIMVIDTENPVMNIADKIKTEVKIGEKVKVPKATATDNYTADISVKIYVICPEGEVLSVDGETKGFVAKTEGVYVVVYNVIDESGNFVTEYFRVTARR